MEFSDFLNLLLGVILASFTIARIVRMVNGAKLDSIFRLTKIENVVVTSCFVLCAVYWAPKEFLASVLLATLLAIVAIGFIAKHFQDRRSANPAAPKPDTEPKSD